MLAPLSPKQNDLPAALPGADYDLDIPELEVRARECYAVVKRESDRLLCPKTAIVELVDRPS